MAKKNRSGFLFMLTILILLGAVIYIYREKFSVLFNTCYTAGRELVEKKLDNSENKNINRITEKIKILNKDGKKINTKIKDNVNDMKNNVDNIKKNVDDIKETIDYTKNTIDKIKKDEVIEKEDQENKIVEVKETKKINSRKSNLYYTVLKNEDEFKLVKVEKTVKYTNTPLTETLKSLLNSPNSSDIISNIPKNTKLLSVAIRDNVAYINFSKEFEYNPFGKEATMLQIKQVVYTATEFPNVKYVQFLINGEVKTYLGGDGIIINKPFSRNDFS